MDRNLAIECLSEFLLTDETSEFEYESRGKIVVQSLGDGTATVNAYRFQESGDGVEKSWTLNSASSLYNAISIGIMLSMSIVLGDRDPLEMFIAGLCPNTME